MVMPTTSSIYWWGKPLQSRTFHVFHGNVGRALCGKWLFGSENPQWVEFPTAGKAVLAGRGDCKDCVKRMNKALGLT